MVRTARGKEDDVRAVSRLAHHTKGTAPEGADVEPTAPERG